MMSDASSTEQTAAVPKGICGIIINPVGHVVAEHADFDRNGYGGFRLPQAQKMRLRAGLVRRFAKAFLPDQMNHKMTDSFVSDFWENAEAHGYRMHLFAVGWSDEEARL